MTRILSNFVQITLKNFYVVINFHLSEDLFTRLAKDEATQDGSPAVRKIRDDSLMLRIRCVKSSSNSMAEHDWVVTENSWPSYFAILLNKDALELRRKMNHNKDLPIDITGLVKQGWNELRAGCLDRSNMADAKDSYLPAVEVLAVTDIASIKPPRSDGDTRKRICDQLSSTNSEIQVLTHDLTIKVTDPFTARLVEKPVRGSQCIHYECFGLEVFLSSLKQNICRPEQFRCPICGKDARPQSLQADMWMNGILAQLVQMGRTDAKAVRVDKAGNWVIKEEAREGESGDGTGRMRATASRVGSEPVVIELD